MHQLPQSQKMVLEILGTGGAMTHKEIAEKVDYSPRTVRHALKKLREKKLLVLKMNLQDMRQIIYQYPGEAPAGNRRGLTGDPRTRPGLLSFLTGSVFQTLFQNLIFGEASIISPKRGFQRSTSPRLQRPEKHGHYFRERRCSPGKPRVFRKRQKSGRDGCPVKKNRCGG